jgi:cytochrome c oxidase subunit 4
MTTEHTTHTPHVLPKSTYYWVYTWLMVLLAATVGAAFINLGPLNFPVTMIIAIAKAIMIALIFMHVRYNERLIWVFAGAAFLWLLILFAFSMNDYNTRDLLNIPGK